MQPVGYQRHSRAGKSKRCFSKSNFGRLTYSIHSVAYLAQTFTAKVRHSLNGLAGSAGAVRLAVWGLLLTSLLLGGCARKLNQWSDGKYYSAREIAQKKREARRIARGVDKATRDRARATARRTGSQPGRAPSVYRGDATQAAASLIRTARTYTGTPYRSGGTTRLGMDCSGLLSTTFQEAGFDIPRTSNEQSTFGDDLRPRELRPGDLLFFATDGGTSRRISHVGLVTETPDVAVSDVLFIHASSSLGVKEDNLKIPYWQRAYVKAVRPRLVVRGTGSFAPAAAAPAAAVTPASIGGVILQQVLKP